MKAPSEAEFDSSEGTLTDGGPTCNLEARNLKPSSRAPEAPALARLAGVAQSFAPGQGLGRTNACCSWLKKPNVKRGLTSCRDLLGRMETLTPELQGRGWAREGNLKCDLPCLRTPAPGQTNPSPGCPATCRLCVLNGSTYKCSSTQFLSSL